MADPRELVSALSEAICEAETIGDAIDAAADQDSPPAWLCVYRTQLRRIREAADAVEVALNGASSEVSHG